jgi:hypothetical protein
MPAMHVVRALADRVAGVTISGIGRVAMTTADSVIEMSDTLVLVTGEGTYILLRYDQGGLTCAAGPELAALWPAEDREPDEWLEVAAMPEGPPSSAFPATVTQVSAQVGIGEYQDVLGLTLRTSTGAELVLSTGRDRLEVVSADEMRRAAREVARWAKMRIEHVSITP